MATLDRAGRRQDDVGQQLVGREHVLSAHVLQRRHREVVGGGHHPLALGAGQPERGAVGNRWHRQAGGMHDKARTVAEDRMKLVFA